jgi:hypothetical protein
VQAAGSGPFTQFACNGAGAAITNGLRVDYVPQQAHALHVLKAGTGAGTVTSADPGINCGATCNATFTDGTNEVLTATPATGSRFAAWTGCDNPSGATCTMSMTADKTVTATFNVQRTLSVAKTGSGSGTVSSSPAGIDCGGACSAPFDDGATVTLTAAPAGGSTFSGWSGGGCSGTGTCVVTLGSDQSVSAAFDVVAPPPANTKIDQAKIDQDKNSATFEFEALAAKAAATSGFQCALVKKKHAPPRFKGCKSPKSYKHLKPRRYVFEVRAFNPAGKDATPAKTGFRIK